LNESSVRQNDGAPWGTGINNFPGLNPGLGLAILHCPSKSGARRSLPKGKGMNGEDLGSYLISIPYEEFQLERSVDSTVGGLCDLSSALNHCAITRPAVIGAATIAGVDTDGSYRDADADAGAGTGSGRSGKAAVRFLRGAAGSGSECRVEFSTEIGV
jgi:hypothetical protein